MQKIIALFLFLLFSQDFYAQEKLSLYKAKADELIAENIEKSLINKIKLVDLFISLPDSTKSRFQDYRSNKDKKIDFTAASFFFEIYSNALDYTFRFGIKIDKDKKIIADSSVFIYIPKCVLQNKDCHFITKDSAKRIAINDSILYTDSLKVFLVPEHKKDNFYWLVTGSPPVDKKTNPGDLIKAPRQRRLINAATGLIMSR